MAKRSIQRQNFRHLKLSLPLTAVVQIAAERFVNTLMTVNHPWTSLG